MDVRDFNDRILLSKKAQFLAYVKLAAETIGAPIPKVNFEGCASFDDDLAHIHIEQNKICISEQYLKRATHEELRETATHEVTHLIDETHNTSFVKAHINVKIASWMQEHTSNLIDDTINLNSDCSVSSAPKVEKIETLESLRRQYRILLSEIDDCVDRGHLLKRNKLLDELIILSEKIRAIETSISEPSGEKRSHPDWVEIENEKHKLDISKILLEEKTTKELTEALKFNELKDKELAEKKELHAETVAEESNQYLSESSELLKDKKKKYPYHVDEKYKDRKREEIRLTIDEKKRLIKLTKAMPYDKEMSMSSGKAQRTIELLNRDISKLEKDLKQLESIDTQVEKIASASPKLDIVESEKESVKPNENHICQYCFKKVSQVYKCTKCSLELCAEHASNHSCIKVSHSEPESHPLSHVGIEPQDKPIKSLNWNAIIIIVFGIILSSFIINSFLDNSNSQGSVTPSNSSNNNAEKVTNPQLTPKDSFEKINEYREQNKKHKILWSDDAYRLAYFRASDMVKRNYFSRTTPDGKTVSDYIGKYNFYSDSTWGENLCKGCSDPSQTWIDSADYREVLLRGWGKGAVACESDICVFIGVTE
ncbi:MAG: hypothetical protein KKG76_06955 [Euryarchaeota archaeon]|nr:hypothetical protein [Euryarchaeota archaeon]